MAGWELALSHLTVERMVREFLNLGIFSAPSYLDQTSVLRLGALCVQPCSGFAAQGLRGSGLVMPGMVTLCGVLA